MQESNTKKVFSLHEMLMACKGLPRVLRLVWDASPSLMTSMSIIMLLQGTLPLANVIIARLLIDGTLHGITHGTIQPIVLPVLLQLGIILFNHICTRLNTTLHVLLNHRLSDHLTLLILRKASTLDLTTFEDAAFYDRLTRARQEAANKPLLMTLQLSSMGSSLVTLLSMLALLVQLNWWLTLIALLVPIPSFITDNGYSLSNYLMMFMHSPGKRQQWYLLDLLTTDTYAKEIKLFNLANLFTERYHTLSEQMYQEDRQLQVRHICISLLWSIPSVLANAGMYLYAGLQTIQRHISLGTLTQYTMAINQVDQSCQSVLQGLSEVYEHHLFITTLFDFLAYEPHIIAPAHPAPLDLSSRSSGLDIEFRNVSFIYPGKNEPALKNISFTLHAGESIALVGQNGAGKTTLVKLLTRLYDPTEGEILVGGRNIKEYDPCELREQIGVIFQDYVKYCMTVSENIGVGRMAEIKNHNLVEMAAHKSGANEIIAHLDAGYDTMLGRRFEKGVDLSGGEWQKVALARAFMRDAPILILDEPTSALDAQAEHDIFQRFRQLTTNRTVIFISHRFSTVRLADRILVIDQGELIEQGSHQELLNLGGEYAELFHLQAQAYL